MSDRRLGRSEELPATPEDELDLRPQIPATDWLDAAVRRALVLIPKQLMTQLVAERAVPVRAQRSLSV
jgi:hypothetical protein